MTPCQRKLCSTVKPKRKWNEHSKRLFIGLLQNLFGVLFYIAFEQAVAMFVVKLRIIDWLTIHTIDAPAITVPVVESVSDKIASIFFKMAKMVIAYNPWNKKVEIKEGKIREGFAILKMV